MGETLTCEKIRENLEAWIRDLETTDAKQATATLYDERDCSYCCLGRGCIVLGGHIDTNHCVVVNGESESGWLSASTRERLGLTYSDCCALAHMNDGDEGTPRQTFPQIAAWLRANVLPHYSEKAAVTNPEKSLSGDL